MSHRHKHTFVFQAGRQGRKRAVRTTDLVPLFKQEPRSRAELDGASALEGSRDGRPLADLTPLADWLRTFR